MRTHRPRSYAIGTKPAKSQRRHDIYIESGPANLDSLVAILALDLQPLASQSEPPLRGRDVVLVRDADLPPPEQSRLDPSDGRRRIPSFGAEIPIKSKADVKVGSKRRRDGRYGREEGKVVSSTSSLPPFVRPPRFPFASPTLPAQLASQRVHKQISSTDLSIHSLVTHILSPSLSCFPSASLAFAPASSYPSLAKCARTVSYAAR